MSDFDPYRKWLGIPPKDRPPHHYRLLGIELFESDPDVIEAHANKQMSYLQGCATGDYADLAEKILDEIASARLCLLNSKKKAEYDAAIRKALQKNEQGAAPRSAVPAEQPGGAAGAGQLPVANLLPQSATWDAPPVAPGISVAKRTSRKKTDHRTAIVVVGVTAVAIVGLVILVATLTAGKKPDTVADKTKNGLTASSSESKRADDPTAPDARDVSSGKADAEPTKRTTEAPQQPRNAGEGTSKSDSKLDTSVSRSGESGHKVEAEIAVAFFAKEDIEGVFQIEGQHLFADNCLKLLNGTGSLLSADRFIGDFEMTAEYRLLKRNKYQDRNRLFCRLWGVTFHSAIGGDHTLKVKRVGDQLSFQVDFGEPQVSTLLFPRTMVDTGVALGPLLNYHYADPDLWVRRLDIKGTRVRSTSLLLNEEAAERKSKGVGVPFRMNTNLKDLDALQKAFEIGKLTPHPRAAAQSGHWELVENGLKIGGLTELRSNQSFQDDFLMHLEYTMQAKDNPKNGRSRVQVQMWGHEFRSVDRGSRSIILLREGDKVYVQQDNKPPEEWSLAAYQEETASEARVTMWHHWQYGAWPDMVIKRLYLEGTTAD